MLSTQKPTVGQLNMSATTGNNHLGGKNYIKPPSSFQNKHNLKKIKARNALHLRKGLLEETGSTYEQAQDYQNEALKYWTTVKEAALISRELYSDQKVIEEKYPGSLYKNINETVCVLWNKKDENTDRLYVVFRGTEIEIENILTNLNIKKDAVDYQEGKIHKGFKTANDLIWPWLSEQLQNIDEKTEIIFTGHSLGGALALIAAARLKRSDIDVYTFGCPRVSDHAYRMNIACLNRVERFVYDRDIVTRLPFLTWCYVHSGNETLFNENGDIISWERFFFILWLIYDLVKEFFWTSIENINNHSMPNYLYAIEKQIIRHS